VVRVASVLLPLPLPEAFDYEAPDGMALERGDHVCVPLGPRSAHGVVTAVRDSPGHNRPLKIVERRLDEPSLPPGTLAFVEWAARYACDLPGMPLAIALRGLRAPPPRPERLVVASGRAPRKLTPQRERVLEAAVEPLAPSALAVAAGVSSGVVKALLDDGALSWVERQPIAAFPEPDPERPSSELNASQRVAADALSASVARAEFEVTLLDGVTGSGKTRSTWRRSPPRSAPTRPPRCWCCCRRSR
jgi:primosomal protein N' (replication factor Y)